MSAKSKKFQRGINLIELLIGIAVSLVILTGVLSVMLQVTVSGGEIVQSTRLNQQLRGALDLMSKELQRAGYVRWDTAGTWLWVDGEPAADPYTADALDSEIDGGTYNALDFYVSVAPKLNEMGRISINNGGDCILFSYDANGDGEKGVGNFENFGFRLANGMIQRKTTGDHSCDDGGWSNVTDDTVTVTDLTFTLNSISADDQLDGDTARYEYELGQDEWLAEDTRVACTPSVPGVVPVEGDVFCLIRRNVAIELEAQLADDDAVTLSLNTKVKLKNDQLHTAGTAE